MTRAILFAAALAVALAPVSAHAQGADSLAVATPRWAAFDPVTRDVYLRRHAFSLDHFLEFEPGGFVVRLGPIGSEAVYSRWGIGRGRALLRLNDIPLNDPQDDSPPLIHTPTSGLGTLTLDRTRGGPWIEGVLDIDELPAPLGRPHTFVELSKGTNDVRQRRVRFSSEESKVGIDLSYDEVLDDGYLFDASGNIPYVTDYGRARSRHSGIVLRGDPDATARFAAGVRGFTSSTQGDLTSNISEGRKSGHVVWAQAAVDDTKLTAFARGYASSRPDSSAESETVGAIASWHRGGPAQSNIALRASVEGTSAVQHVGAVADDHVVRALASADATLRTGAGATILASFGVAGDEATPFAWSARVGARRDATGHTLGVSFARSFRLPNFGERYLPAHTRGGFTLAGDGDVDPETAWEAAADWSARVAGGTTNRLRASWIRAQDTIAFRPRSVGTETWRVAANASQAAAMVFVEERIAGDWKAGTFRILTDLAGLYTSGDREEAFASVPRFQASASLRFGRDFFEETSALFLGVQFVTVDERTDFDGNRLPAFQVLNVAIEGRLLDARLYLQYLNVMDEAYRTQADYLMTPRTLAYGIEWTLFN